MSLNDLNDPIIADCYTCPDIYGHIKGEYSYHYTADEVSECLANQTRLSAKGRSCMKPTQVRLTRRMAERRGQNARAWLLSSYLFLPFWAPIYLCRHLTAMWECCGVGYGCGRAIRACRESARSTKAREFNLAERCASVAYCGCRSARRRGMRLAGVRPRPLAGAGVPSL